MEELHEETFNSIHRCFACRNSLCRNGPGGDELTITSWGGAYSRASAKPITTLYGGWQQIAEAEYDGEVAKIKAMVEANAITWDVITLIPRPLCRVVRKVLWKPLTGPSSA